MGVKVIYESSLLRPLEMLDLLEGDSMEIEIEKDGFLAI